MKTLTWTELFELMDRDNGGRWTAKTGTPAEQYIDDNGYRTPSRAWPHSHSKPLLTRKFAKWMLGNYPRDAKDLGLTV